MDKLVFLGWVLIVSVLLFCIGCTFHHDKCGVVAPHPVTYYCDRNKVECPAYILSKKDVKDMGNGVRAGAACRIKWE